MMDIPVLRWDRSPAVEEKVEQLVAQLTLAEKVALVSGRLAVEDDGTEPERPTGLPRLALADSPAGIRLANPKLPDHRATALPAPLALAATWDPDLAHRYGRVLGAEAAMTGHNIFLGPAVDIARAPRAGRTFESFGEDPLLQSRLAVAEIEGIQAQGVVACVKHYIVNNQEHRRSTIDVIVDERTLQEIYLPPFAAAMQAGGAGSVMGSYNRINGVYACENPFVLTSILRDQLGFRGFVMSDFLATQSTAAAANAGLDWELGAKMWGPQLLEAVVKGDVEPATLDEMVRRILRPILGLQLAGQDGPSGPLPVREHGAEALAIAEQGIVLLKNEGSLLPLQADAIRSIAVIGPDADNISGVGGGSAFVQPAYAVSVLDAIRQRVGASMQVEYAAGVDPVGPGVLLPGPPAVPQALLAPNRQVPAGSGLLVEYWDNPSFAGAPVVTRVEPRAELNFGFFNMFPGLSAASPKLPGRPPELRGKISVRWRGVLVAPADGEYRLALTYLGSARLLLDGQVIIDEASPSIAESAPSRLPMGLPPGEREAQIRTAVAAVPLAGGAEYDLVVEYAASAPGHWIFGEAMLRLGWQPPAGAVSPAIAAAAALAARSDAAVVVVRTYETEEMDRPNLRLPNAQDVLIRAVSAANPKTVVVLMNAAPVAVSEWEEQVPALVEAWFAGQEQGNAVARVLFGDVNPRGKLPITFPRDESATPIASSEQYPGVDGKLHYTEGVNVGYRGYDSLHITPQYPFGHGLSYTSFEYADLQVSPPSAGGTELIQVDFVVANTGQRAGTEVAQVYIAPATAPDAKRLVGWARVALAAGELRPVRVTLDPQ
ncbi:MAG: glycoside hydrolase family 3 C-terminal domain-containing protein, partial [Caldilineaceae bacterium]